MKFMLLLGAAALLSLSGCSNTSAANAADLNGAYDLALVGDLVFITSSDRNELRVLDLSADPRDFIRAPNPLEPLSIPVLAHPVGVTSDAHYDAEGIRIDGPYVYARSPGLAEVSVVSADREVLREMLRVETPGPVTAVAARGPSAVGHNSTLYYAVQQSTGSLLLKSEITVEVEPKAGTRTELLPFPGETVVSLLIMPDVNQLAVATRSKEGKEGRTLLLDVTTGQVVRTLEFGRPIRFLATHGKTATLAAGAQVFGLVEEASCDVLVGCAGVLSVETNTGVLSVDSIPSDTAEGGKASGAPMVPIWTGGTRATGLALAPGASLGIPGKTAVRLDLLGIVPSANGSTYLFDGATLKSINLDETPETLLTSSVALQVDGTPKVYTAEVPAFSAGPTAARGAARSEEVSLMFQGALPGLAEIPVSSSAPGHYLFAPGLLGEVAVGDIVQLEGFDDAGNKVNCDTDLVVTAVQEAELTVSPEAPAECAAYATLRVRAGGALPYTVRGSLSGPLGRAGPNQPFIYPGTYFFHPSDFVVGMEQNPQLAFTLSASPPELLRDERFVLTFQDDFEPYSFRPDLTNISGFASFTLPGAVVYSSPQQAAYIGYPSADGLLEARLGALINNGANTSSSLTVFQ